MAIRSSSADQALKPNKTTAISPQVPVPKGRPSRLSRIAKRWIAIGCLGVAVASTGGCSVFSGAGRVFGDAHECCDEFMIGYRNRAFAEKAWIRHKDCYGNRPYQREFKAGFVAGYLDIASGGYGCCPSVAPEEYWGWRYQSTHGHYAVNAWFEGFPLGVKAAEQDGVGHWGHIRTSGTNTAAPLNRPAAVGDPNVANPFYSDEQYVPVPVPEPEPDAGDAEPNTQADDVPEPETVFNRAMPDFPVGNSDEPELLSPTEIARRHEAALAARMSDQDGQSQETTEVIVDNIFGSLPEPDATESDSQELPFTFE